MGSNYLTGACNYNGLFARFEVKRKPSVYFAAKRVFDVSCSLLSLVVLSPVFLITGIAIYLEDRGPVFFVQERNGVDGEVFRMYKFRSMRQNAEEIRQKMSDENELDGPAFKLKHDPRITKVGKFIRKTSIDELPQLLNIIRGEMSIVGPRPLPVYETKGLNEYQRQRMLVKPGLTCYWQCSGRNDIPFDQWMELDMKYIREANFLVDLKIILKTVKAVLCEDGAY